MRSIYEYGDSQDLMHADRPYIQVHIQTADSSPNPNTAASPTSEFFDAVVTFLIHCDRDENAGFVTARAVEGRLRAVFQNKIMTSLTDTDDATRTWYFGPAGRVHFPASFVKGNKIIRRSPSYRIGVSKGTN